MDCCIFLVLDWVIGFVLIVLLVFIIFLSELVGNCFLVFLGSLRRSCVYVLKFLLVMFLRFVLVLKCFMRGESLFLLV